MRTRVKICGITRVEDGLHAARCGADAVGLVFYPPSPRVVELEQANAIARALPPFVTKVGLFVDATEQQVRQALQRVPLDLLQFHGNEPPAQCERYGRPYIKAVRMHKEIDLTAMCANYRGAVGLLLDTFQPGVPGGTGQTFEWARVPSRLEKPLILAGGLTPENVAQAVRMVHPYAVDVSSGVESIKGIKDWDKVARFTRNSLICD